MGISSQEEKRRSIIRGQVCIQWNKFHFVANLIAFKMITNLTSDYTSIFFLGMKIPLSRFSDTVC